MYFCIKCSSLAFFVIIIFLMWKYNRILFILNEFIVKKKSMKFIYLKVRWNDFVLSLLHKLIIMKCHSHKNNVLMSI